MNWKSVPFSLPNSSCPGALRLLQVFLSLLLFPWMASADPAINTAESDVAAIAKAIRTHVETTFEIPGDNSNEVFLADADADAVIRALFPDRDGTYADPWGSPYEMLIDTDLDGRFTFNDTPFNEACLVRSIGPDKTGGTTDDIYSSEGVVGLRELGVKAEGTPLLWLAIFAGLGVFILLLLWLIIRRFRKRRTI